MKKNYLLLLLLSTSIFSFAQFPNWMLNIKHFSSYHKHLGQINETNNSILFTNKHTVNEISYYGEPIKRTIIDFNIPVFPSLTSINTIVKRNINDEDIYIISLIRGNRLYFTTSSLEGEPLSSDFLFIEHGSLEDSSNTRHNVFEKANGDFLVFGETSFFTVRLNNDLTWQIISSVEHTFLGINSVKKAGNQFIITTHSGTFALLSENLLPILEVEIGTGLAIGSKVQNGYVVCANDEEEHTATIYKISNAGEIEWQEVYENKTVLDIMPWEDDILLAGDVIFTINAVGDIRWEKKLPENLYFTPEPIHRIQKNQLGSILMLGGERAYLLNINSTAPFNQYSTLAANNIGTHISPFGNIAWQNGNLSYPVNDGTATVFTNSPIFVGMTESSTIKGYFDPYSEGEGLISLPDYFMGGYYNTTWKIYQKEIDIIQQKIAAGVSLAPYSKSLLTYPAKGNPNCVIKGDTILIDYDFAPFVDVNGDGIYNMFDGDYPEMKGDQMIWWAIAYDNIDMKIHGKWYAYACGDHIISNTVYVEYELFNTSIDNLFPCFFGEYIDFDLGCHTDDYIGSLPVVNSIFSYNYDAVDGTFMNSSNCSGGQGTYGTEIPVQSITFLDEPMGSAMYHERPSSVNSTTIGPSNLEELSNFMQAKFKDGTPLTYGGTGYDLESTNTTSYVYADNPANLGEWSMSGQDTPLGDYRMITSSNAFSLNGGESKTFTFAYTTHPNIPHPAPDVTPIIASIQEMTNIYDNGNDFAQVLLGQDQTIPPGHSITLYAGDDGVSYDWSTNEDGITIQVTEPGTYSVTVTDETGCQRSDEINISMPTGISDVEVTQLAVYPNPAKSGGSISIELPTMEQISTVKLFNIIGQELYSEMRNEKTQQVDLKLSNTFSAGVYMIQLTNIDGKVMVGKVVIE